MLLFFVLGLPFSLTIEIERRGIIQNHKKHETCSLQLIPMLLTQHLILPCHLGESSGINFLSDLKKKSQLLKYFSATTLHYSGLTNHKTRWSDIIRLVK